jgi:hypothetical protein
MLVPVFILACPRSGATALAAILNRHPSIRVIETNFFNRILPEYFQEGFSASSIPVLLEDFRLQDFLETINLDPLKFEALLQSRLLEEKIGVLDPRSFYEFLLSLSSEGSQIICDKSSDHIFHFKKILELYPDTKFIEIIRDGRDVVNSLVKMPWRPNNFLNNARYWVRYIRAGMRISETLKEASKSQNLMSLKFEDLMTNPAALISRLCAFLNLEYRDDILESSVCEDEVFPEWQSPWKSRSRSKPNSSRIKAWKKEIPIQEQAILNLYLRPWLDKLGYEACIGPVKFSDRLKLFWEYLKLIALKLLRLVSLDF